MRGSFQTGNPPVQELGLWPGEEKRAGRVVSKLGSHRYGTGGEPAIPSPQRAVFLFLQGLDGDRGLDVLGQPLPRHVQTTLDRPQRRVEGVAHLQQRLALNVERDQGLTV
jgi:hypothetical protein